ncbi:MAG: hypothetical protein HFG64_13900 [Lachnospiraceae bacterium]|nr:hypothetical protein [Lachnospiraceae bacterium]
MAGCWLRNYKAKRWEQQKVTAGWRRLKGRKYSPVTRRFASGTLAAGVILGCFHGAGAPDFFSTYGLRLVSKDRFCHVEWVASPDQEGKNQEIYGIRFDPENLELQFYHETEEMIAKP